MSKKQSNNNTSFINTHTHIFTKEHVPKYLAKQILPNPIYKWFPTVPLVRIIKCYLKQDIDDSSGSIHFRKLIRCYLNRNKSEKDLDELERKSFYSYTGRKKRHQDYLNLRDSKKVTGKKVFNIVVKTIVWLIFAYYLFGLILPWLKGTLFGWLFNHYVEFLTFMPDTGNPWNSVILLLIMMLLFKTIRKALKMYIKKKFVKAIGKEKLDFLLRYINIARFSSHEGQAHIFNQLKQQYPKGSKFVVLPMDMEYMDADDVEESYPEQMTKLVELKNKPQNKDILLPFIFVDPRRIEEYGEEFLKLNTDDPKNVKLEKCQVKDYIDGGCAGIKIYPALGYYVFDKLLLPLWLYCAQNGIPITTHCSIGPVFYRGDLEGLGENYDLHPIFDEVYAKNKKTKEETIGKLRFHELKNKDFQKNFTHPLNYVCLFYEPLLREVVKKFDKGGDLKTLFDYDETKDIINNDLSQLKINLAHYGSAEMWQQFLDKDRSPNANAIIKDPINGLDIKGSIGNSKKRYDLWHHIDWFSIISSMMMEFENLYTDVSYTAHDLKYLNLLSEILDNPNVANRVLYGTDFYVVSNHKTEKQYWIDMQNALGTNKWQQIANINPTKFLTSKLPGSI